MYYEEGIYTQRYQVKVFGFTLYPLLIPQPLVSISGAAAFDVQKHQVGCLLDQHSDSPDPPLNSHKDTFKINSLLLDNVIYLISVFTRILPPDEEKKGYTFPERSHNKTRLR